MPVLDSPFELPSGRLLGLDLGMSRSGVAVSDEMGMMATPLAVLRRHRERAADFRDILALVARERVVGVVVGLPTDDSEKQARWVRRYAGRLARVLPVPLAFWDESLSTVEASELLVWAGGRSPVDAVAAAVVLRDFLEARRGGQT